MVEVMVTEERDLILTKVVREAYLPRGTNSVAVGGRRYIAMEERKVKQVTQGGYVMDTEDGLKR